MEILDARGLSCPEPVIMLSKAMMSKENKYQREQLWQKARI